MNSPLIEQPGKVVVDLMTAEVGGCTVSHRSSFVCVIHEYFDIFNGSLECL